MKALAVSALIAIATASALPAHAQNFPNKPVRIVLGFGPGGVVDAMFRSVADELAKPLGQPVIVENRTGAGGLVAAQYVKGLPPDGYTIMGGGLGSLSSVLVKENPMDAKDMTPIANAASGDWFLYVPASLPVRNLADLTAYAKSSAKPIRFAAPAVINQMLFATVAKRLGFEHEIIPYKASDQVIQGLLAGDAAITINSVALFQPQVQAGKLRALATLSPGRTEWMPDVPTASEQGLNFVYQFNLQLWGPGGMQRAVVNRLNAATGDALKQQVVRDRMKSAFVNPAHGSPEDVQRLYEAEVKLLREAADLIGFKPN